MSVHEVRNYLEMQVLIAPMDYPGQRYVRCTINHSINTGDVSNIREQIGLLHISLNSRKTVFLLNYQFFDKLFHEVFGRQKVLAKKPKLYKIIINIKRLVSNACANSAEI